VDDHRANYCDWPVPENVVDTANAACRKRDRRIPALEHVCDRFGIIDNAVGDGSLTKWIAVRPVHIHDTYLAGSDWIAYAALTKVLGPIRQLLHGQVERPTGAS